MPDELHKLQKDPPEGSRKIIERELERQPQKPKEGKNAQNEQAQEKRGGTRP
jgi:hypothetical protein